MSNSELHDAAAKGDATTVRRLLEAGANVNGKGAFGSTPLHCAASVEVAEILVANGADLSATDGSQWTVLHIAAYEGRADIVRWLVEKKGLDMNARIPRGETPLELARDNCQWAVVKTLEELAGSRGVPDKGRPCASAPPTHKSPSGFIERLRNWGRSLRTPNPKRCFVCKSRIQSAGFGSQNVSQLLQLSLGSATKEAQQLGRSIGGTCGNCGVGVCAVCYQDRGYKCPRCGSSIDF